MIHASVVQLFGMSACFHRYTVQIPIVQPAVCVCVIFNFFRIVVSWRVISLWPVYGPRSHALTLRSLTITHTHAQHTFRYMYMSAETSRVCQPAIAGRTRNILIALSHNKPTVHSVFAVQLRCAGIIF